MFERLYFGKENPKHAHSGNAETNRNSWGVSSLSCVPQGLEDGKKWAAAHLWERIKPVNHSYSPKWQGKKTNMPNINSWKLFKRRKWSLKSTKNKGENQSINIISGFKWSVCSLVSAALIRNQNHEGAYLHCEVKWSHKHKHQCWKMEKSEQHLWC